MRIKNFLQKDLKDELIRMTYFNPPSHIYEPYGSPLSYTLENKMEAIKPVYPPGPFQGTRHSFMKHAPTFWYL